MYLDDLGRVWNGPFPFRRNEIRQHAPVLMGVYQILYEAGGSERIAYIGIATGDTIRGRLIKHVSGSGNWALGRLGDPAKFSFVFWECDSESARQIESHVVTNRRPPFNVRPEYRDFIPSIAVH